jgi:aminopeptidase-like protein
VLSQTHDRDEIGVEIHDLISRLFPITRSITGDGVRETLAVLSVYLPLTVREVRTGTKVFDWTVPREWNIEDAFIKDSKGNRVVDYQRSNLHVVSYSVPIDRTMSLEELKAHLHSIPEHPKWIPYRTSYYDETWGFCLSHEDLLELEDETYRVCIRSSLENGSLTYGECYLPGELTDEVLISAHVCHPSLANDNLSGVAVATLLARSLSSRTTRYSYRFVFAPATIGAITWLALNEDTTGRIKHGLVLACVGDPGHSTYKRSRQGDAEIDRVVEYVLAQSGSEYEIIDFSPYGYDERQYGSPGFKLPVGSLMRTPNARFPEYHTSADNLDFVTPASLADSYEKCLEIIDILESSQNYLSLNPKGEPQLGKRGLYRALGGTDIPLEPLSLLWVLNMADGTNSLLDIAQRSQLPYKTILTAARLLEDHRLLRKSLPQGE